MLTIKCGNKTFIKNNHINFLNIKTEKKTFKVILGTLLGTHGFSIYRAMLGRYYLHFINEILKSQGDDVHIPGHSFSIM